LFCGVKIEKGNVSKKGILFLGFQVLKIICYWFQSLLRCGSSKEGHDSGTSDDCR
jgi:hypothetical protein